MTTKEIDDMALETLNGCHVEGNIVYLPEGQLDRAVYKKVKDKLDMIGGQWNKKQKGFVFMSDPTEKLERVQAGEMVNLKKKYQYFATPIPLAAQLVALANIKDTDEVLEPSAGQGNLIKAIRIANEKCSLVGYELMKENYDILEQSSELYNFLAMNVDFLQMEATYFDKIVANPPFSKNQDIDHVYKMYEQLKEGGQITAIMSNHWRTCNRGKENKFQEWFRRVGGMIVQEIENGAFKESGTNVAACIVVITK